MNKSRIMTFNDSIWMTGKICLFATIVPAMEELRGGAIALFFLGCACALSYLEVLVRYVNAHRSNEARVDSLAALFKPDVSLSTALLLLSPYLVALVAANVYSMTNVGFVKWACLGLPFVFYIFTIQKAAIRDVASPVTEGQ